MQNSFGHTESTLGDGNTPSTQPLECLPERKKDISEMRKRLKLQPFSSCKAAFASSSRETKSSETCTSDFKSPTLIKAFDKAYSQLEDIGQGSCGVVKKVLHLEENEIYAAKIMRSSELENIEQMKREYQILSKLQHKNIIKAKEFFYDEPTGSAQLVVEYFPGKNLEELIKEHAKDGHQMEEEKVKHIIQQVVAALKYVHEKGVCHRDVTAANILVNDKNEVKLIDFSISRINRQELWSPTSYKNQSSVARKKYSLFPGDESLMISNAGTDAYKAPEIVNGALYNQSVDMWALGVVTFYALVGYKPFRSKLTEVLYRKINRVDYDWDTERWAHISQEAAIFVQACLKKAPFIRLSSKEACYHPWIKGVKLDWEIRERGSQKRNSVLLSPPASPKRERSAEMGKFGKSYVFDVVTIN